MNDFDLTKKRPRVILNLLSWCLIGTYDPDCAYEFKDTEYVEFEGKLYIHSLKPTADELKEGYNVRLHDPQNSNIKKHMVQLALYELHKLIPPII